MEPYPSPYRWLTLWGEKRHALSLPRRDGYALCGVRVEALLLAPTLSGDPGVCRNCQRIAEKEKR